MVDLGDDSRGQSEETRRVRLKKNVSTGFVLQLLPVEGDWGSVSWQSSEGPCRIPLRIVQHGEDVACVY